MIKSLIGERVMCECFTIMRPDVERMPNFGHRSRSLQRAVLEQIKVAASRGFQCEIEPREKGHWMNCQAWQREREQRFQPVKMKRIVANAKSRSETMELVNRISLGTSRGELDRFLANISLQKIDQINLMGHLIHSTIQASKFKYDLIQLSNIELCLK